MKNLISILLFSLFAITGLAQQSEDGPPANPKAVVIKGLLTDVPDGTEIMIFRRDPQSSMGFGIESAKVKNGKFNIVIRPKGWKEEYSISPYDRKKKDIYAIFVMWLRNRLYKNERTYKKLQDVISSVGGIYESITIIAVYINTLYNKFIILSDTEVLL